MQIYLDLIWALNLLFDWLVLLVVGWLSRMPFSHKRIFIASFFASLIIPLSFVPALDWLNFPIVKLVYSFGIILIAFRFINISRFITYFFSFYLVNFTIGGGLFGLHYILQSQEVSLPWLNHIAYGNLVSWIFVLIGFPIFLWFTKDRLHYLSVIKLRHEQLYDVVVQLDSNRKFHLKGFYDTGNQLTHPLTQKPIMLIDEQTGVDWFGDKKINRLKQKDATYDEALQVEYIPLKMAGGEQDTIPVFQIQHVGIRVNQYMHMTKRVYVGIHFGEFSNRITYNCLLHPLLLQSKNTKVQHVKGVI
ncbi:sporulation factor SpoIIGA [Aquisalibacillus elongatus]|uniref:Sporulation sigma-E factor-processing peptidase n=1 Tax=Aquisalibacillus elongatus TaxID=485577 RepID=A0A3N5BED8_9BACI|nr:sporulation factor SpoIIGA [Aquisalibacillus elongatus]